MMPTPLKHQQLGASAFGNVAEESCKPVTPLHYATNRPPAGKDRSTYYRNGSVDRLQLGRAKVRRGDDSTDWSKLVELTTSEHRKVEVPMRLEEAVEDEFIESVNRTLDASHSGELTIFVPGAQSSFYKSCAHATQLQHFMAGHGAVVTFSWPSTGRFVGYPRDTRFARKSIQHLADLIEHLAGSTDAEKIHIVAYSAGAMIAAPALAMLRDRHPDEPPAELRRRYRIANLYLAAPDVSTEDFFTEHLPAFRDFVGRTTFTYNRKDVFLKASKWLLLERRLGLPAGGRHKNQEESWLRTANSGTAVEAIDLEFALSARAVDFRPHGAWYCNPWVSSDLILLLQRDAAAAQRGLKAKPDGTGWYFSADYPQVLEALSRR